MESAIAPHLQCPRTRHRRIEDDYTPPYPCWTTRPGAGVSQVVMAYFGVQSRGPQQHGQACRALMGIRASFSQPDGPGHHDLTHYTDADGYDNMIAIAYWSDPAAYRRWRDRTEVAGWWDDGQRLHDGIGYFREVLMPRIAQVETMFNTPDRLEGVGAVMDSVSGEFQEHGYWGSMRDRIPLAQTDALAPRGGLQALDGAPRQGRRVRIAGHENVAIIRSGQEWTDTAGKERELYLRDMEPVLAAGMDFLRDQGRSVGCYSNRYMRHIDAHGKPLEKSFGVSYWRSLADMERWSESHPTHVEIFAAFMRMVQQLQFQLKLTVYHEVAILKPDEQDYEYINCHPRTGLLNALTEEQK